MADDNVVALEPKKRGRPRKTDGDPIGRPETGTGGSNNFGNNKRDFVKTEQDRALVSLLMEQTYDAYKQTKVTSDEELVERLDTYFQRCVHEGRVPIVEEMAHYTGYTQSTVWDWENGRNKGFSAETSAIIKKAKEFIKSFDGKLAVAGKINPILYFFRAKNYYGMVDKQEHVLTPNTMQTAERSEADLLKLYGGIEVVDESTE